MSPPQAVFASSLRDFGALFAVLYLGLAIDRIGPERTLALHYAVGAVFIAVIALVALPYALLLPHELPRRDDDHRQPDRRQRHLREALSRADAHQRPRLGARHRTAGGIAAPLLGGYLLASGMAPTHIFLSACLFALIAAAAVALLAFRGSRVQVGGVEEVAS